MEHYSYPLARYGSSSNSVITYDPVTFRRQEKPVKKRIIVFPETPSSPMRAITIGLRSDDEKKVQAWLADNANPVVNLELDPAEIDVVWMGDKK